MSRTLEKLRSAMERRDLEALVDCFTEDYEAS
jgi:hypothetical protein